MMKFHVILQLLLLLTIAVRNLNAIVDIEGSDNVTGNLHTETEQPITDDERHESINEDGQQRSEEKPKCAISPDHLNDMNELEDTVSSVLQQLRNRTSIKVPGVDIPDPMILEDFATSVKQGLMSANVKLWNVTINGMSDFLVDEVLANLANMDIKVGLNITELIIDGMYDLKGTFSFFKLTGNGNFSMRMIGAYTSGMIVLGINDEGILEVDNVNLDINVTELQMKFENLLGGGALSGFSNTILNALSKIIFSNVKPMILDETHAIMRNVLNERFNQLPPQPMLAKSKSPLDVAIANSAAQIREFGLDPYKMPDLSHSFNRQVLFVKIFGNLTLYDGYLRGLSTLHRTGEILMAYKNNTMNATAEMGFEGIEGGYKWKGHFMGISRKGGVHFRVKKFNLFLLLSQINEYLSHPKAEKLEISRLDQMIIDMDGLGSFDFLVEFFTNFFGNVFKKQFSYITQAQVKRILQQNLNQIQLPY